MEENHPDYSLTGRQMGRPELTGFQIPTWSLRPSRSYLEQMAIQTLKHEIYK
jgi:hypothetical protein